MKYKDTPNIVTLLKDYGRNVSAQINCVDIGKVINFDAKTRTVDVELQHKRDAQLYTADASLGENYNIKNDEFPTLFQVPIVGEFTCQPIQEEMYCLVFFSDRCIDGWFSNDVADKPVTARLHDINDGFALIGIGNLKNSSFIAPDWWEPPADLPYICDCPIPKYGYQPEFARLRYDQGDVNVGYEPVTNSGVVITARDYSNVTMYAEGSAGDSAAGNIQLFPTNSFIVNNDRCQFIVHGDSDMGADWDNRTSPVDVEPEVNVGGKITLFNPHSGMTKVISREPEAEEDDWWVGKTVLLSDMYRTMAQCKACLSEASKLIASLGGDSTGLDSAIMDFKERYSSIFAPVDPVED